MKIRMLIKLVTISITIITTLSIITIMIISNKPKRDNTINPKNKQTKTMNFINESHK